MEPQSSQQATGAQVMVDRAAGVERGAGKRERSKRLLLRLGMLIVAGAIINVAVAWACGFSRLSGQSRSIQTADEHLNWWRSTMPPGFESIWEMKELDLFAGLGREVAQWPPRPRVTVSQHIVQRTRSGWPALALEHSSWYDAEGARLEIRKHAARVPFLSINSEPLGLKPLWPGFAINTIFYAAIVWLLFLAPFKLRRWRRMKRGLCPVCAYPVGMSDNCTECGTALR